MNLLNLISRKKVLLFFILISSASPPPLLGFNVEPYRKSSIQKEVSQIDLFFDQLFINLIQNNPQLLSQLRIFENLGLKEHNRELNDVSPLALFREFNLKKKSLTELQKIDLEQLPKEKKISAQVISWSLEHDIEGRDFLFHEFKINQLFSVLTDLTLLFTQSHQLNQSEDFDAYIARLHKVPRQLAQTIELMEYQKKRGIIPPAFAIEKVVQQIRNLMPEEVTNHPFYSYFKEHAKEESRLFLVADTIKTNLYPAYQKLLDYCLQLPNKGNFGAWSLPNGDLYYQYQLEHHTTTKLSADQIHELGLKEVDQIQKQIRALLASLQIVDEEKEVGQLMAELSDDPQFYYPNTEAGRLDCLEGYEKILERSRRDLHPLFDLKPNNQVQILPVPKHEEIGAPLAYYLEPSLDRSRAGIFFINLSNLSEMPRFQMETLTLHEAEPGHHFQISLQQEMEIPLVRKVGTSFNAYVEGWALYVEKLGYEEGFYSSPYSQLGHLQFDLMRAARLVVDTGIHKKRWSREEAIDYMQKTTGKCRESVTNEVERYFVLPGQACSYKIGQLKILELREKAKKELGDLFDIRQFHNVVLNTAAAPLIILEMNIDQYIKESVHKHMDARNNTKQKY